MRKKIENWTVAQLQQRFAKIEFPEYQREPNVWSRVEKQRLIDSMVRQFDIASLYIYDTEDGSYDCIDGRQRINAIMAFLGDSKEDRDNNFELRTLNEIYVDEKPPFEDLERSTYEDILKRSRHPDPKKNKVAKQFVDAFCDYQLTMVKLSKSAKAEEFNLQFTRLNLGTIINSGEKLNAMVGAARDVCFDPDTGLGQHRFLAGVGIPTRRYSKEQIAAQILAQVFSLKEDGEYTRTRHFDLQKFFKENAVLSAEKAGWLAELRSTFDTLATAFVGPSILHNRAVTVSTVLLAWKRNIKAQPAAKKFAAFIDDFLCRLSWQIGKGLDVDDEYRYLTDFQRHVTQASVEKPAVAARAQTLETQYDLWLKEKQLSGDVAFRDRTGVDPAKACKQ